MSASNPLENLAQSGAANAFIDSLIVMKCGGAIIVGINELFRSEFKAFKTIRLSKQ